MSFPPPPTTSLNWENVGFNSGPLNGHVESRYDSSTQTWSEPQIIHNPYISIHGLSPSLNYGQQVFEGLKAFRTPEGKITIFRPEDHAHRLNHSATYVSIPQVPKELFLRALNLVVSSNAEYVPPHDAPAALYIRPLLVSTESHLQLSPAPTYLLAIYVQPLNAYHGTASAADALVLEDFDRAAPRGTGSAKVGGNYAPVLRWSEEAKREGYGITLHLDSASRTEIDEFSTSGAVCIKAREGGGYVLSIPDSKNVVSSITSRSVIQLSRRAGWDIETRSIKYEELPSFDEVIAAGTAATLVPIRSITRRSTSDRFEYLALGEKMGPCCAELLRQLQNIQRGVDRDEFGWCEEVVALSD